MNRISFRVRYAETDAMGVVHHARYLPWMELGRTELMRGKGFSYREMEKQGHFLPLLEASCKYHNPARYDDEVIVETQIEEIRPPFIIFTYRIFKTKAGVETLLVTGMTRHVCTNKENVILREPLKAMAAILGKDATAKQRSTGTAGEAGKPQDS